MPGPTGCSPKANPRTTSGCRRATWGAHVSGKKIVGRNTCLGTYHEQQRHASASSDAHLSGVRDVFGRPNWRHKEAVSTVGDLTNGCFQPVIDDANIDNPPDVRRLVFCTGKVFYDLAAKRNETERDDVAIVRIEQLYPFETSYLQDIFNRYSGTTDIVWAQEEPKNMGAWMHIQAKLREFFGVDAIYVGRKENASPAVASKNTHQKEQDTLVATALGKQTAASERQTSSRTTRRVKAAS